MWYVYVLSSLKTKFMYIGSTTNLERRLTQHNNGELQSTKAYVPYKVSAYVAKETEKQARNLEQYFRKAILLKRILGLNPPTTEALA